MASNFSGNSFSDLGKMLKETGKTLPGREEKKAAASPSFDPLHPFTAKKKPKSFIPAGAKPFFQKVADAPDSAPRSDWKEPVPQAAKPRAASGLYAGSRFEKQSNRPASGAPRTSAGGMKAIGEKLRASERPRVREELSSQKAGKAPAPRAVKRAATPQPALKRAQPEAAPQTVLMPGKHPDLEASSARSEATSRNGEKSHAAPVRNRAGKSESVKSSRPVTADASRATGRPQKGPAQLKPRENKGNQNKPPRKEAASSGRAKREEERERPRNPIPPFELAPGLPVSLRGEEIVKAIRDNQVLIVSGETGSGKTTQLPKLCLMAGRGVHGLIGHTQPRRIAASSVAKRIAEELHTELGEVVGYKVRFTDHTSSGSTVKLMTDGILLAETQTDPLLRRYDTIIIDEAHERSINIDFLLGYLKQILPRRPDLKVIITSATIDTERFAKHFGRDDDHPAPIISVSGRTYPVEIRYRPVEDEDSDDDRTLMDAISSAVDELELSGRGDVLVFLPGEREIREAADVLRRSHPTGGWEILPLYARLPAEDQERIFKNAGGARRIVLATNVAETSITVPGIRYVVDTGLARVKRYSYRNKVEQLQIEPISKAACDQRSGRCGRVSDGICIRLFSEEDFARRPAFTDPEIMRSNLAAVILRMKSLGLGDVRAFPFVQPPPARAIADGYAILSELNCVDDKGDLTGIGRTLAKLPVDPKLSRILLAGSEAGALAEVLIIAAGLSVQDPRERPPEQSAAADEAHKRLSDPRSDFLSYLKLWNFAENAYRNKESNRLFENQMKRNFLSPRKLREWRDVVRQLMEMVKEIGWRMNTAPATFEEIHRALLSGLLGCIGMRRVDADFKAPPYAGARGIRYWIWPGSPRAKKCGPWIVAAEIVETSKLFARCVADVDPLWIEKVGAHILKKAWTEPHWEKKRGEVVALERGTVYGLPVYASRTVSFGKQDPALARELFIREALVAGNMDSQAPFYRHNQSLIREIQEIEQKSRRPDVLVDEEAIFRFYDERLGAEVCSLASLEKWRKSAEAENPKVLWLSREELMNRTEHGVTLDLYPKTMDMAGVSMALGYYFDPGSPRDGVTLTVPLFALNQIDEARCEWLVPGMLKEKIRLLVKSLPPRMRRQCVPIADYADEFFARHSGECQPAGHLLDALIVDLREEKSVICEKSDFKLEQLPPHLRMNYKVIDDHGRQLEMSRSIAELRAELGAAARETFQGIAGRDAGVGNELEESLTTWSFGELPELMEIHRKGQTLIGVPALVDRGESVSLEVFDDPLKAAQIHRRGLCRLFRIQLKEQVRYIDKTLRSLQSVMMQASSVPVIGRNFDGFEAMKNQVIDGALERTALADPLPSNRKEFYDRLEDTKGRLTLIAQDLARTLADIVSTGAKITKGLNACKNQKLLLEDINSQMDRLFPKEFLISIPAKSFANYPRYLSAIALRLEKYRNSPDSDREKTENIRKLEVPFMRKIAELRGQKDPRLEEFRWLLEELRVSLFAQQLRTPMPVSVKRLQKIWDTVKY